MSRGSGTVVRGTVEYRNTAEPCEDMPRKSLDIRFTDYPVPQKRGLLRPFPAFRRGRVRAEPANGSRDESLVGFGATPQGLKTINICNFQGSLEPVFSAQFFHRLLDTTYKNASKSPIGKWTPSHSRNTPMEMAIQTARTMRVSFHPVFSNTFSHSITNK
ncbi:hypothetical protein HMPREF1098_00493 [[Clostridium] clostridioforme CM201]|nr:hypothetical protein HMPREF1098_00493 [[Clostridium] clostridioforme CM201]